MSSFIDLAPIVSGAVATPVVMAMVQAIKMTGTIPKRFMPLVAILVGTLLGLGGYAIVQEQLLIFAGFMSGLAASGLYEAVTSPLQPNVPDAA